MYKDGGIQASVSSYIVVVALHEFQNFIIYLLIRMNTGGLQGVSENFLF